ncbi:hypothetical protein KC717_05820, partial [Candidatus Dojkabacteria bacterium]|nr:hypothetical protein [Candidatus Dojkabacteria bacterium]
MDPIDRTKFFAAGIPSWVVTIALTKGEEGKLGFIYNPNSQQLYSAIQGEGAYLNNERIELNKELDPAKLQVAIDTFQKFDDEDFYQEILTLNNKLVDTFYRVRALGTGALSLAWLSQGFFGAYVDYARKTSKQIDVVGGLLIASEAGAIEEKWE